MSVLLLGRGHDPVLAYLADRGRALGVRCDAVDAGRIAAEGSWDLRLPGGGVLRSGTAAWDLSAYTTVIARGLELEAAGGPAPHGWAGFVDSIGPWLRTCRPAVVNPPAHPGGAPPAALALMAAMAAGLPAADWRWELDRAARAASGAAGRSASGTADGSAVHSLYVVGEAVLPSPAGPGGGQLPGPEVHSALARATASLGWLLARWDASVDRDGVWRWRGADPGPDLRRDDGLLDGGVSRAVLALRSRPPRSTLAWPASAPRGPAAGPALHRGGCRSGLDPCPCGSPARIDLVDRLLAEAADRLDHGLQAPERWQGPMRRESLRYGTAPERAHYEDAFNGLARDSSSGAVPPLTVDRLRALHVEAGGDGALRTVHLWIPGGHTFPHPAAVLPLLQELCAAYEEDIGAASAGGPRTGYSAALRLHLGLLTIHPFRDGNGRLSRLVAARELMRGGYRARVLTILDQHYEQWPHVYTALLTAVEDGRICRPACVLGMQLAALVRAWREAPALARTRRAASGALPTVGEGALAQILGPVLADAATADEGR
ncbi:Fic family protein [Sinomonas sp. RB5]